MLRAAPRPDHDCRTNWTAGHLAAISEKTSEVRSVDPSSTRTTSVPAVPAGSTDFSVSLRWTSALRAGTTMETSFKPTRPVYSGPPRLVLVEPLVWTEVFGCGPIAGPVVESYVAHHSHPLTVYGMPTDLAHVPRHPHVQRVVPSKSTEGSTARSVAVRYRRGGHAGTAHLWAGLIRTNAKRHLIHIDSDQVFIGNAVDEVLDALCAGAAIAGPRRTYMFNDNGRDDVRHLPDTVATFCFGFQASAVPHWPRPLLERAIRGQRVSKRPVLDFFDPVTHAVIDRGCQVNYLDAARQELSGRVNPESEFLSKIISMPSGAASGCAISLRAPIAKATPYQRHSLASWKYFEDHLIREASCRSCPCTSRTCQRLARLDRETWRTS